MSIKVSRRRWMLSFAIASTSVSFAVEPPGLPLQANLTSTLPIPTRAIRLQGDNGERVVVTAIAVDPRGEFLAAAGDDHAIRIIKTSNLSTAATLGDHRDLVRTLAFDPDGNKLVSAGNDGQLIVWNRRESFAVLQKMQGAPALACVRFSPDGSEMAAVGFDETVFIIGRAKQERPVFQCDCNDLRAVAYRDDHQRIAVVGRSGKLLLFDARGGELISDTRLHRGRIHDVVFHHQANTAVCVGEDGNVTVFDTENQRLIHRIEVPNAKLFAAVVLNSQLVAVAGSDNLIRILNTDNGTIVRVLEGHHGSVSTLAAGGGLLFSGSYDATLRRWSVGDIDPSAQRIAELDPRVDR